MGRRSVGGRRQAAACPQSTQAAPPTRGQERSAHLLAVGGCSASSARSEGPTAWFRAGGNRPPLCRAAQGEGAVGSCGHGRQRRARGLAALAGCVDLHRLGCCLCQGRQLVCCCLCCIAFPRRGRGCSCSHLGLRYSRLLLAALCSGCWRASCLSLSLSICQAHCCRCYWLVLGACAQLAACPRQLLLHLPSIGQWGVGCCRCGLSSLHRLRARRLHLIRLHYLLLSLHLICPLQPLLLLLRPLQGQLLCSSCSSCSCCWRMRCCVVLVLLCSRASGQLLHVHSVGWRDSSRSRSC